MFRLFSIAFFEAQRALLANLFRTLLSTLGIIIGVGALVAILSLADGMERFGREQLASTTNLSAVVLSPETHEEVDGILMKKENVRPFSENDVASLEQIFGARAAVNIEARTKGYVGLEGDTLRKAAIVKGIRPGYFPDTLRLRAGNTFDTLKYRNRDSMAVLSWVLAERLAPNGDPAQLAGRTIHFNKGRYLITGILPPGKAKLEQPQVFIPFYCIPATELAETPPSIVFDVKKIEDVSAVKTRVEQWLGASMPGGKAAFRVLTNDYRLEQTRTAILVFKIIMGMITGIAVLVGGIGIMNVLLMSITERTREIGIRKALGAKRSSIAMQFLAESLVISLAGCVLGILLGIGFMAAAVPIVRHWAEVPFSVALSWNSALVVLAVAVFIGIAFGTYPAVKASKLLPVDAIRHE